MFMKNKISSITLDKILLKKLTLIAKRAEVDFIKIKNRERDNKVLLQWRVGGMKSKTKIFCEKSNGYFNYKANPAELLKTLQEYEKEKQEEGNKINKIKLSYQDKCLIIG